MRRALSDVALGEGWRRLRADSLHVTLAFLGQLDAGEPVVESVRSSLRPISVLSLGPLVLLPPRRPRVMAVKLAGEMAELQSSVSAALAGAGIYTPEKRPFLPHVTIGRARERASRSVPPAPALSFMAASVSVYESRLSPKGATYEALATFPVPTIGTDPEVICALRLAALADSPASFGTTLEEESARPGAWWEDLARRSAEGVTDRVFVVPAPAAVSAPVDLPAGAAGIAGGRLVGEDVVLWGMWVAPPARGRGLARALLDGIVGWARSIGAARVILRVHDEVPRAAKLYAAAGFEPTHRAPGGTQFALRL